MSIIDKILKLLYLTSRQNLIYKIYEKHLTGSNKSIPISSAHWNYFRWK